MTNKQQMTIDRDGVTLALYQWRHADVSCPTIVLVHGYPDSATAWDSVAKQLAQAFHVVSYDVRGTGLSSAPSGNRAYDFQELVADLAAVIAAVSPERPVHLVGHDWGALQAWEAVLDDKLKSQIASYTALAPGLDHVGNWFQQQWQAGRYGNAIKQAVGSAYMGLFQLPLLPELTWRAGLDKLWPNVVGRLEDAVINRSPSQYKDASNGLALYRQNLLKPLLRPQARYTTIPVHLLVMTKDPFVPKHLFAGTEQWVQQLERTEVAAGHWGILSQPHAVAAAIGKYVSAQATRVVVH
jgi:pimeloyl-ACP methyl ester carboxylesterase